ncbi:MAG TPA: AAA domain-containing protein, partial [Kineosporiaceae bacterium]|nr:AAA domain-containing protein [Kineosporiaceae bacterium]
MPDDVLGRPLAMRPSEPRAQPREEGAARTPSTPDPSRQASPGLGWAVVDPGPRHDRASSNLLNGPATRNPATAGPAVAGPMDAGRLDSGRPDSGRPDAGPADAGAADAGAADAGLTGGPAPDAGQSSGAQPADESAGGLGVIDGWWATLAAAPLPDTLLGDGDLAADGLDLSNAHPSGLATLLAGRPTRLSSLVREPAAHAAARRKARAIRTKITDLGAQRGVRAGFLALGLVSWWATDSAGGRRDGRSAIPVRAPLLLRGCDLHPRGAGHEDYEVELDAIVTVNLEVLRRLREDHRIRLDGEALGGLAFGSDGFDPGPVYAHLEEVCAGVPGFSIDPRLVVSSFTAGSGALLGDLDAAAPALRVHPLIGPVVSGTWPLSVVATSPAVATSLPGSAAMPPAGPATPQVGLTTPPTGPRHRPYVTTDEPPDPLLSILPLDPAQRRAVRSVRSGSSVAVQGPPGTGLTQTLAAAVAALVGAGQRVLIVTPHQAAARTLVGRLQGAGLRQSVLDLHDGWGDRPAICSALAAELADAASGVGVEATERLARTAGDGDVAAVQAATAALTGASAALHAVRGPWGVSAYDAMEALSALMATDCAPRTRVRLPAEVCRRLDGDERERLRADLHAAADVGAFTLTRIDTRWLDAAVRSDRDAEQALDAAIQARDGLRAAQAAMNAVAEAAGLTPSDTVAGWRPQLELLLGVRDTLDAMQPAIYEQPIDDLVAAVGPERGPRNAGVLTRRSLRRRARALVRPGVHVDDLHSVLDAARRQRVRWQELSTGGGWPVVPTGLAAAGEAADAVEAALATLGGYLAGTDTPDLRTADLDTLARRLGDLAADRVSVLDQPQRTVLLERLREAGLGELIVDLRDRRCIAEDVDGELDLAWWTSVLEAIIHSDPRLARHDPAQLAGALEELRTCSDRLAAAGVARVHETVALRIGDVAAANPEQLRWLQTEVHSGHRSQWPADLFRRTPDLLAALRPVLVMSPDAVARSLPAAVPGRPMFDVVVVDDANQVGMPEVAAALARGRRVLLAGDPQGLPPASGRPSVLEALTPRLDLHRLDRDHRTRDGRLLAPLLRRYPLGWAVTPGAAPSPPLELEHVWEPAGARPPGETAGTEAEIQRVVELVSEHATRRPGESLLVVTLGARHAERIEEALRHEVGVRPDLARWLEVHWTGRISEPFLVRPVHQLCGLERDAVIVSVGLSRTPHGRVLHKFGVLDGSFGPACLTAALSRARRRTTVVCSFTAGDLDPDRLRSDGARMLWEVLALIEDPALRGDHAPALPGPAGEPVSGSIDPLVADLRDRLLAVGLPVLAGIDAPDWPSSLVVADE